MQTLHQFSGVALCVLLLTVSTALAETRDQKKARILAPTTDFSRPERFEAYQGGSGTNHARLDRDAFSQPSGVLTFEQQGDFHVGNGVFDRMWVAAPSSTIASDGLGPYFNARSCQGCHLKDGRGHPPSPGDTSMVSMLFGLSDPTGGPDPVFGRQFQDLSIAGLPGEGRVTVTYEPVDFAFPDGDVVTLRKPIYATEAAIGHETSLNPRIAPPMIGLGLVEAIDARDLAAQADPNDLNGDGVSGRISWVGSAKAPELGRFGWKATAPSLEVQSATAFSNDMGLSTWRHPAPYGDCTTYQTECIAAFHGNGDGGPEVTDDLLALVTFYAANLAVPARRDVSDPEVLAGKALFYGAGCPTCHVPKFATRADAAPEQRNQLIWPYSDFLLHDLGPGLADANPTGDVSGGEWRTTPLWGIGLTKVVNGHTFFLHDGRARSIEEAILWHGGEAEASRDAYATLSRQDRASLLRFLESL